MRVTIPRRSRPRRVRKGSLAAKKRTLWRYFAAYVKERDGSLCFTCGKHAEGVYLHAGHLFSRRIAATWVDPFNVHSQCASCNRGLRGNIPEFVERFIAHYGVDQFQALTQRARRIKQWKEHELDELIEALKQGGDRYELLYGEWYW